MTYDLVVRNGTVVTAADMSRYDVGVKDGRIIALANDLPPGGRDIDANGKLILPGGIDSHCHIEQMSAAGIVNADDFYSGTMSAAFGGTTTVIPFGEP
ncbi:amidohydrolase family protein [Candidatus Entotheonella palauensis]|uniref:amidohydrolase family protein n=1 Tax=Candidatus Entotheonella palauensis TaxID=93172 RepID=UPI000B7C8D27|nr:amidohydrolase family protein [Candidatus Entotheonella palauensis]